MNVFVKRYLVGNYVMGNLGTKALKDLAALLTKDVFPKLASKPTSSILDKIEIKISGQEAIRAGKECTLFISNEDVGDIIKIVELLEKSGLLIDGASETLKHELIKQ